MRTFDYLRPTALADACAALRDRPEARVLAGGTDLFAAMKRGIASPDCVVSLAGLPQLRGVRWEPDGALRLGALTRLSDIAGDEAIGCRLPILAQAAGQVGSPQIRHVGTLGGNLLQKPRCWYYRHPDFRCQQRGGSGCPARVGRNRYHAILGAGACCAAHPSDLAPALLALDVTVEIASLSAPRQMALARLWEGPATGSTTLAHDEILTAVRVPAQQCGCRGAFLKVSERQATDFALVSVAAVLVPVDGASPAARLALGGVAPFPWRTREAEGLITREGLSPDAVERAADAAVAEARPLAENGYKVALTRALIVKTLKESVAQLRSRAG